MRNLLFVLAALLLVTSAMAEVKIECTADGNEVTVTYDQNTADPLPRGFGLDITVDGGATIDVITYSDPNFWVYPGSIVITGGIVTTQGIPVGDPCDAPTDTEDGLGTAGITVEMGSLYDPADGNIPDDTPGFSGTLLKFTVTLDGNDANVVITENAARGGVVLENVAGVDPNFMGGCVVLDGCACPADITGDNSLPPTDGDVSLGDLNAMLTEMIINGKPAES